MGEDARRTRGVPLALLCAAALSACMHDWEVVDKERAQRDAAEDAELPAHDSSSAADAASDAASVDAASTPEPSIDAGLTAPDAAVAPDASREPELDAGLYAQQPDAGPPDAQARFCASLEAGFCADFEDGLLDAFSWEELTPTTQASLRVVADSARGGGALESSLTGAPDEAARVALWLADAEPSWFHAAFDFLPRFSLPAEGGDMVFWFKLSEQTGQRFPGVGISSDGVGSSLIIHNFDGAQETYDAYPLEPLPSGWVRVDVTVTFGASGSAIVRFNGQLAGVFTGPLHTADVAQSYLQLGVYAQQAPAASALYDNVVVEFAP